MLLGLMDLQASVHGRSDPLFWAMGTRTSWQEVRGRETHSPSGSKSRRGKRTTYTSQQLEAGDLLPPAACPSNVSTSSKEPTGLSDPSLE